MNQTSCLKKFEDYLLSRGKSKSTTKVYTIAITQFLNHINKDSKNINISDIESYCKYTRQVYHSNSLTPKFSAIKNFLKSQKRYDLLEKLNEEELLKPPKIIIPDKEVLTKKEVQQIFDASKHNLRDHAILKTLYYTTQRRGSIIDIKISDIKQDIDEIHIRAKGDREYDVDINPEALQAIKEYLKVRPEPKKGHEDVLFLSDWGTQLTGCRVWQIVKECGVKAGIKKRVYPHLFRTTSITHLDAMGMTEHQIIRQSGHANTKSLKTYIRPDKEMVKTKVRDALSLTKQLPRTPKKEQESKTLDKTTNENDKTDQYIARLEERIQNLERRLRDKENGYMYG
ncbi:MAG: tyrosine-type recombinase/integrase [Thermoplasmatales archaeon]|nr:MAG: tyrosine-type recombinase/integrase [Thermoplasmatales archaeon]